MCHFLEADSYLMSYACDSLWFFPLHGIVVLSINRAQGQSVSKCVILLPKDVWTHGKIYVAFSRCGNPNNIYAWAEQSQFDAYNLPKNKNMSKT